ncbi:MAG TPA: nuclear transport factor 2 family protein [Stellaceae bacterium]|nr:nuclear transport factor 2 family protein [Stellaceae bacterium]
MAENAAEAEIRKIVDDWASAVRKRDLPAILRNHSSDIWMFDVPPPFQSRGIEAYRKTWDPFFAWAHDPAVFEIREMRIVAGSDVAFVAAAMRCAGREAGGENVELDFRLTIGLRKVDGLWVIVHEHHSVPAGN